MPLKVLVTADTLPLEPFTKAELFPSERKTKNGANFVRLAYKSTNMALRTRKVNGKNSNELFGATCSRKSKCT